MSLTLATVAPSPFTEFRRHFVGSRSAILGLTIVSLLVFSALAAPLLAPHGPDDQMRQAVLHPPTWLWGCLSARHR